MQDHYNYVFDDINSIYQFTTKNNISYRVAFVKDETFSMISSCEIDDVFQLVVDKTTDLKEPLDLFVSKTIEHIISSFFRNTSNSLIYVCSGESDVALKRHKVFDRWYSRSVNNMNIVKFDSIIRIENLVIGNYEVYTSYLIHRENNNYKDLSKLFFQLEDVLNSTK